MMTPQYILLPATFGSMRVVCVSLFDQTTLVIIYCLARNAYTQQLEWISTRWCDADPMIAKREAANEMVCQLGILSARTIVSYIRRITPYRYVSCIIENWKNVLSAVYVSLKTF